MGCSPRCRMDVCLSGCLTALSSPALLSSFFWFLFFLHFFSSWLIPAAISARCPNWVAVLRQTPAKPPQSAPPCSFAPFQALQSTGTFPSYRVDYQAHRPPL